MTHSLRNVFVVGIAAGVVLLGNSPARADRSLPLSVSELTSRANKIRTMADEAEAARRLSAQQQARREVRRTDAIQRHAQSLASVLKSPGYQQLVQAVTSISGPGAMVLEFKTRPRAAIRIETGAGNSLVAREYRMLGIDYPDAGSWRPIPGKSAVNAAFIRAHNSTGPRARITERSIRAGLQRIVEAAQRSDSSAKR